MAGKGKRRIAMAGKGKRGPDKQYPARLRDIRITTAMRSDLEHLAEQEHVTVSDIVRTALRVWIDRYKG